MWGKLGKILFIRNILPPYRVVFLMSKENGKTKRKARRSFLYGAFSKGALSQKTIKKKLFISLLIIFGLFRNITWSVISELEVKDLKRTISKRAKYIIAEDLPRNNVFGIGNRDLNENSIVFCREFPQKLTMCNKGCKWFGN